MGEFKPFPAEVINAVKEADTIVVDSSDDGDLGRHKITITDRFKLDRFSKQIQEYRGIVISPVIEGYFTSDGATITVWKKRHLLSTFDVVLGEYCFFEEDHSLQLSNSSMRNIIWLLLRDESDPANKIVDKLDSIVVDHVSINDKTIAEAMALVSEKAKECDPKKIGIKIVVAPLNSDIHDRVTVNIDDITLRQLITLIEGQTGLCFEVKADGLYFGPPPPFPLHH